MGAENPIRRNTTARELAQRLGASPRTVRKIIAEPRDQYLARAATRRQRILELRRQGWTLAAIATELDTTPASIGTTLYHLRKAGVDIPPPGNNRGRKPKTTPETRETNPGNTPLRPRTRT